MMKTRKRKRKRLKLMLKMTMMLSSYTDFNGFPCVWHFFFVLLYYYDPYLEEVTMKFSRFCFKD
jgi:hypothetical protein